MHCKVIRNLVGHLDLDGDVRPHIGLVRDISGAAGRGRAIDHGGVNLNVFSVVGSRQTEPALADAGVDGEGMEVRFCLRDERDGDQYQA